MLLSLEVSLLQAEISYGVVKVTLSNSANLLRLLFSGKSRIMPIP